MTNLMSKGPNGLEFYHLAVEGRGETDLQKPIVAIIGRPNVGKSSLFNRIIRRRVAVVDDLSGITRDRNYAEAEWSGRSFVIVDTGGFVPHTQDKMEALVKQQVQMAIEEADLILFLVDVSVGISELDLQIAKTVQKGQTRCLLVVNKIDSEHQEADVPQFYRLGLGEPIPVSAMTGRNSGDLLDRIIEQFPPQIQFEEEEGGIKIAITGRPNVGKSSFVNALLGEERAVVHQEPGTTRDSTDTEIKHRGQKVILIDTAGLRKRTKIKRRIEFYSSLRAIRSLQRCDVAVALIDATEGLTAQDIKILLQAVEFGKGIVLAVNKWDLIEKDSTTADEFTRQIKWRLASLDYIPVIFTSALTHQRVHKTIDLSLTAYANRSKRIPTPQLNRFLGELNAKRPPSHRSPKLFYGTQQSVEPPAFLFFSNKPELINENYKRWLENRLREEFGFEGTPIRLFFRKK